MNSGQTEAIIGAGLVLATLVIVSVSLVRYLVKSLLKMKDEKARSWTGLLLAIVLIVAFCVAMAWVVPMLMLRTVSSLNKIESRTPLPTSVSPAAKALFAQSLVADLHADSLLWPKNLLERRDDVGHVDLPRLLEGNVALQGFTIVTRVPRNMQFSDNPEPSLLADPVLLLSSVGGWGLPAVTQLSQRVLAQSAKLHSFAHQSRGQLRVIRFREDLQRYLAERTSSLAPLTAGYLGIEGLHALEGRLDNVDVFFDAGVRTMGPAHFFDNDVAASAHGLSQGGLTPFGRQVVRRMQQLHVFVDIAHASLQTIDELCDMAASDGDRHPLISSHTGLDAVCPSPRNIPDRHIHCVARSGGLIGIGFFHPAICTDDEVGSIVKSIRHVRDLVGIRHVAFGSDFDGAVATPFDVSQLVILADRMLQEGFTQEEVQRVLGLNTIELFLSYLPSSSSSSSSSSN